MTRKTRRYWNRRHKRFERILSLLEASNADSKHRNRKTRMRTVLRFCRADFHRREVENANGE